MRWILLVICMASSALAAPTTAPATRPSTQPVEVPFKLTDTNHLMVRLKINGQGPYNFIVDTGAPSMILRVPVGQKLGLKPNARNIAYLDQLEIEGGLKLQHVMCVVDTPYQIEGMNAIGASGVDLDGLLGYSVLAKFRLQIDMSKDRMIWTPVSFDPPAPARSRRNRSRPSTRPVLSRATSRPTTRPATEPFAKDEQEAREDTLESAGGLLKILGPLIKNEPVIPKQRGFLGIELAADNQQVSVLKVLGDSPAAAAGVKAGDRLVAINDRPVNSIFQVQQSTARVLAGQMVRLSIRRGDDPLNLYLALIAGEGL
jgi:hypothetical protein